MAAAFGLSSRTPGRNVGNCGSKLTGDGETSGWVSIPTSHLKTLDIGLMQRVVPSAKEAMSPLRALLGRK